MSYMDQVITNQIPQSYLKNFNVKFCLITQLNDVLNCLGIVINRDEDGYRINLVISLSVCDMNSDEKLNDRAEVTIFK